MSLAPTAERRPTGHPRRTGWIFANYQDVVEEATGLGPRRVEGLRSHDLDGDDGR
jgi:hypothetical protein